MNDEPANLGGTDPDDAKGFKRAIRLFDVLTEVALHPVTLLLLALLVAEALRRFFK